MFGHIAQHWRSKPLNRRLAVVKLIAATTTKTGLSVRCEIDTRAYPMPSKVNDTVIAAFNIKGEPFHAEQDYAVCSKASA